MGGKKNKIEFIFSEHHLPMTEKVVFDICIP